ncbi:xylulokinase [Devosia elaeis]|uniref:Xylulose kinase n=1 Tax=Devosia elaeis TaxID=1770058 RepID=A0A178HJB3_9HYPH|nr:xylulokinase [Devosia elaeis]OAM72972.1 xylulokinase [Devosia elaeis]
MRFEALLGIDVGTSSCKALLLDPSSQVLATHSADYPVLNPHPGWSEQDPECWIAGAQAAVRGALSKCPGVKIIAIGLSGQMHGLTPLDKDHTVLRPAILWNDQRNADEVAAITEAAGGLESLLAQTNNPMLTGYTGGKIAWMRRHEPELYPRMRHALNPKDYLRLRLTGEVATEVSDASGTGLFDVRNRQWARPLIERLGIDPEILPPSHESDVITGRVSVEAAEAFGLEPGIPVVGGGGDAVIQTLGSGVIDPGDLQTTLGTAGILAAALDTPAVNPKGRVQVFCNIAPDRWHAMGVSLDGAGLLTWFQAIAGELADGAGNVTIEKLVERASKSPPGARGLVFLPYLSGGRCPHPDPHARGAFVGLTRRHGDADMVRSLLEGAVYGLRDMYDAMASLGLGRHRIVTSGGGTRSTLWRQMQADIFGCDVVTTDGAEAGGAMGAAMVAGIGVGIWADASTAARLRRTETRCSFNPELQETYTRMFTIYQSLYPLLRDSFTQLGHPGFDAGVAGA